MMQRSVREVDPEVADALGGEVRRQAGGLELIASENFVSEAVLETVGSVQDCRSPGSVDGLHFFRDLDVPLRAELLQNQLHWKQGREVVGRYRLACRRMQDRR